MFRRRGYGRSRGYRYRGRRSYGRRSYGYRSRGYGRYRTRRRYMIAGQRF